MNQKMGEDDPSLLADLKAAQARFKALLGATDSDLHTQSATWDGGDAAVRSTAASTMAALLDRRRYLSNLVRDVNDVLSKTIAT